MDQEACPKYRVDTLHWIRKPLGVWDLWSPGLRGQTAGRATSQTSWPGGVASQAEPGFRLAAALRDRGHLPLVVTLV